MQEVISKILLDYIAFIAATNNEIIDTKMRIYLENMPEYGHPADLDHGFWAERRLLRYSGTNATSKHDELQRLPFFKFQLDECFRNNLKHPLISNIVEISGKKRDLFY